MLAANNKLNDKNFMVNHLVDELCQLSGEKAWNFFDEIHPQNSALF